MKKMFSSFLMVSLIVTLCSGCGSVKGQEKQEPVVKINTNQQEPTGKSTSKIKYLEGTLESNNYTYKIVSKGEYFVFTCDSAEEYVMFLDELDEWTYDIVDIQVEHYSDANYFVTYKKK